MYRNVTEMSHDRNGPDWKGSDRNNQSESARPKSPVSCDLTVAMIDKTLNGFNLCCHQNFWPSTLILYSRGSQPGVHVLPGVHLPSAGYIHCTFATN